MTTLRTIPTPRTPSDDAPALGLVAFPAMTPRPVDRGVGRAYARRAAAAAARRRRADVRRTIAAVTATAAFLAALATPFVWEQAAATALGMVGIYVTVRAHRVYTGADA